MLINVAKKSNGRFLKYGLFWEPSTDPASMEMHMISKGGSWTKKSDGTKIGEGLYHHFRKFQEIVWPGRLWQSGPFKNHWADACLESYLNYTYVGVMGCAASGKSDSFGCNLLTDWYAHSSHMTGLVTSTDLKSLELRIWGMIKKYHKLAKSEYDWIPGNLIEGKQMLILDSRDEYAEGRDFKNGIIAVATRKGNQFVGLGSMIGIHNKRVVMVADELNLCPRAFLDSSSNLSKCESFKLIGLGNPNETTNAHGTLCEPAAEIGGWEGGIDQTPGTKTWKTRFPNGVCLQLPGSDSPNMKVPDGAAPAFPFLVTRQQMLDDAQIWGIDDWHYTMMNEARMPRGQGSRRVLTRQACQKFGAFEVPNWRDSRIEKIGFLDAAYRGVGGDRCVFGELNFGFETESSDVLNSRSLTNFADQTIHPKGGRQIVALIDLVVIPITADRDSDQPEDQIVNYVQGQLTSRGIQQQNFFYDAGMKTTLVSAFARNGLTHVNTIDFGGRPSDSQVSEQIKKKCSEHYSKFVTELWFSVRYVVESRQFRGMTEEACTEFGQREWKMVSGNRIEVETKAEMKLKTGRSPDLADSIAVGIFGARQRGFVVSRLAMQSPASAEREQWKEDLKKKARDIRASGQLVHS